jgi:hypothetical protein
MKTSTVILLPLMFLAVACSSAKERTLTVGTPLERAVGALTAAHAHQTDLDMMPPGEGKELKCFELSDGRLVCLIAQRRPDSKDRTIVEIGVCRDADKPKAQRTWTTIQKLKL